MYTDKQVRPLKPEVRNAIRAGKIYGSVAIVLIAAIFFIRHAFPEFAAEYKPYAVLPVTLLCIGIMVRLSILLRRSSQN